MWNYIRDDVARGLQARNHTGRLIITGISLGGALSVLSYVDISRLGIFDNIEIITFGAPRVVNKKWAQWFDSITESTRYFIKNDPIAVLPRCLTLLCNYHQTGVALRCNKKTEVCQQLNCPNQAPFDEEALGTIQEYIADVAGAIQEHSTSDDDNGIIDHIYGYKKIYNYDQINC